MTIYLSDPRFEGLSQIGQALGQAYAKRQMAKQDSGMMGHLGQMTTNLYKSTPEEMEAAKQKTGQLYGGGLIGTDLLQGISQEKQNYAAAVDDTARERAHSNAGWLRGLATIRGIDTTGYNANDPLKTPDIGLKGGLFGPFLAKQEQLRQSAQPQISLAQPGQGLFGRFLSKENTAQPAPQQSGSLARAASGQLLRGSDANKITFDDVDRRQGGALTPAAERLAAQTAQERANQQIRSGELANNFYRHLLSNGYSADRAKGLMQTVNPDMQQMQAAEQRGRADAWMQRITDAYNSGDAAKAAALSMQANIDLASNIGTQYLEWLQPEVATQNVNAGNRTVVQEVRRPGKLGVGGSGTREIGSVDMNLSPGQVQAGSQFNKTYALQLQRLDIDQQNADRQYAMMLHNIDRDDVKSVFTGYHQQLQGLTSDVAALINAAKNELDSNVAKQYIDSANQKLKQKEVVQKKIDDMVDGILKRRGTGAQAGQVLGGVNSRGIPEDFVDHMYQQIAAGTPWEVEKGVIVRTKEDLDKWLQGK